MDDPESHSSEPRPELEYMPDTTLLQDVAAGLGIKLKSKAKSAAKHCRKAWTGESPWFRPGLRTQLSVLLAVQKSLVGPFGTIRTSIGPYRWKLEG